MWSFIKTSRFDCFSRMGRLAQTPVLWGLRFQATLFRPIIVASIPHRTMPCYQPHGSTRLSHAILQFPSKSQTPNIKGLRRPPPRITALGKQR